MVKKPHGNLSNFLQRSSWRFSSDYQTNQLERLEAVRPEEEELIVQGVRFVFRVHQEDLMQRQACIYSR
ncbi:hypothetical protein HID58_073439 [Brassica napus]|uniref:Uncharacterized protein n=1 Tax=Brassica napus TaxID=3708 RepID=A0ABQ7Z7A3_BRANA|nr:hypothetical protein HID58_073439 [Brassica napus]